MGKCLIFVLIGIAFVVFYVKARLKGPSARAVIRKSLASMCFILTAGIGIIARPTSFLYGAAIVVGLVWSMLGDIWLDLKYVYPDDSRDYTHTGFLVFAAAHFFFMMAMIRSVKPNAILIIIAVLLSVAAGVANGTIGQNYVKVKYGEYQPVTIFYGCFAAGTFFTALMCIIGGGAKYGGLWMVLAGGLLFCLSDLILARTYFGKRHDKPIDIILNYALYYAAQFLIALSVVAMK